MPILLVLSLSFFSGADRSTVNRSLKHETLSVIREERGKCCKAGSSEVFCKFSLANTQPRPNVFPFVSNLFELI